MTKRRDPATFDAAALEAMHLLGVDECARIIDRGPGAVRKYADPEADGRPIIHHALRLDIACFKAIGATPFLAAYKHLLRLGTRDLPPMGAGDPVMETLDVAEAVGTLSAAVKAAACHRGEAGADLSPAERLDLLRQIAIARREIDQLEAAVRGDQS
ncbi:hypothetical protein [Dongia sp.]|uniref:hypothetical protein n=1 Tax=Dongia sp. TaxID=1977262 RepID=UPI0035B16B5A